MKPFELIYSTQSTDYIEGRAYANPRFFSSPRSGVTKVLLVGEWPIVRAAYEALGVPVERMDQSEAERRPIEAAAATAEAILLHKISDEERAATVIPADWRDLPWSGPDGLTLRGLATVFAAGPVINSTQAMGVLEAEVARRAGLGLNDPEPGPELPPGEIPADWEALHWKRRVILAEEIAGRKLEGEALGEQANDIIAAEVARLAAVDVQGGE